MQVVSHQWSSHVSHHHVDSCIFIQLLELPRTKFDKTSPPLSDCVLHANALINMHLWIFPIYVLLFIRYIADVLTTPEQEINFPYDLNDFNIYAVNRQPRHVDQQLSTTSKVFIALSQEYMALLLSQRVS